MLYIVNKILNDSSILSLATNNDYIILIEDGVYNLKNDVLDSLNCNVSAIKEDLIARNISDREMKAISYSDFVQLCAAHEKICQL